jgi:hypothetical protein
MSLTNKGSPVLLWSFDGTMVDSVKSITMGGTPNYTSGYYGQGIQLVTGTANTVSLPSTSNLITTSGLSFCTWINLISGTPGSTKMAIQLNSSVTTPVNSNILKLWIGIFNNKLAFYYNDYTLGFLENDYTVATLNTWYHICAVLGGSGNKTLSFYINGVKQTGGFSTYSVDMSGTTAFNSVSLTGALNNTVAINDLRVYNYPLTNPQIQGIINSTTPRALITPGPSAIFTNKNGVLNSKFYNR